MPAAKTPVAGLGRSAPSLCLVSTHGVRTDQEVCKSEKNPSVHPADGTVLFLLSAATKCWHTWWGDQTSLMDKLMQKCRRLGGPGARQEGGGTLEPLASGHSGCQRGCNQSFQSRHHVQGKAQVRPQGGPHLPPGPPSPTLQQPCPETDPKNCPPPRTQSWLWGIYDASQCPLGPLGDSHACLQHQQTSDKSFTSDSVGQSTCAWHESEHQRGSHGFRHGCPQAAWMKQSPHWLDSDAKDLTHGGSTRVGDGRREQ